MTAQKAWSSKAWVQPLYNLTTYQYYQAFTLQLCISPGKLGNAWWSSSGAPPASLHGEQCNAI